jgi:hypothetical protein
VFPSQQPNGQSVVQLLHAPALHVSHVGHVEHAPPAAPQAAAVLPSSHVVPEQHPPGQEVALQTHASFTQL